MSANAKGVLDFMEATLQSQGQNSMLYAGIPEWNRFPYSNRCVVIDFLWVHVLVHRTGEDLGFPRCSDGQKDTFCKCVALETITTAS